MKFSALLLAMALWLTSAPALAENPLTGTWMVVEAKTGPWYEGKEGKPPVNPELDRAKVVIAKSKVQGPSLLACTKAKFTVNTVGPDYLFQGVLKNPEKDAAALGFQGSKITLINQVCLSSDADREMDFALVDKDTALFGLDNVVYKMKRVQP